MVSSSILYYTLTRPKEKKKLVTEICFIFCAPEERLLLIMRRAQSKCQQIDCRYFYPLLLFLNMIERVFNFLSSKLENKLQEQFHNEWFVFRCIFF
jgi:hypothetical protein